MAGGAAGPGGADRGRDDRLSEAAANALEHAYGRADYEFEVYADRAGGEIMVEVCDFGARRAPRGWRGGEMGESALLASCKRRAG